MSGPPDYRNVFFFVAGRTPQIITETLFFYWVLHRPAIFPHEIRILTTREGQDLILEQLLGRRGGWFYRFCTEYGLEARRVRFSSRMVEVLRSPGGDLLEDIRTEAENRAAADQILAKVRTLTQNPKVRLYASLAGGRKTMGLYLGFALQFYGRPQDRLSHVLISPPSLEGNPHFFYPSSRWPVSLEPHEGPPTITVAEVPVLLLGHKLKVLQGRLDSGYGDLVAQSQREVDLLLSPLPLRVDPLSRRLQVGEASILLSGLEFVLYLFVVQKRKEASCPPSCSGCEACTVRADDFLKPETIQALEGLAARIGLRDPRLRDLGWWAREGEGARRFLQLCARIKRKALSVLGDGASPYVIAPLFRRGRVAHYAPSLRKTDLFLPVRLPVR